MSIMTGLAKLQTALRDALYLFPPKKKFIDVTPAVILHFLQLETLCLPLGSMPPDCLLGQSTALYSRTGKTGRKSHPYTRSPSKGTSVPRQVCKLRNTGWQWHFRCLPVTPGVCRTCIDIPCGQDPAKPLGKRRSAGRS